MGSVADGGRRVACLGVERQVLGYQHILTVPGWHRDHEVVRGFVRLESESRRLRTSCHSYCSTSSR